MLSNKKLYIGIVIAGLSAGLTSCDNIPESERFIPVEKTEAKRVTLVQEFTGVWCTNCPQGAAALHQAMEDNPGNVIVVSMHPIGHHQTRPLNNFNSLPSEEATIMYNYFYANNDKGFPAAMINGATPNSEYWNWVSKIDESLKTETSVKLDITTDYDSSNRKLSVNYDVTFTDDYNTEASIMIWVIENDIIGPQIDGARPVMNYVHNHVLRASVNGDWGESLGNSFRFDETVSGEASMMLDNEWVAENCQVVAYVFDTAGKAVQQATIADVIK